MTVSQKRPQRPSRREAAHYSYMADVMRRLEWDLHNTIALTGRVPPEWHEIARAEPHSAKARINLWVEGDVVRFFRSMGPGWGPRMADVLKSYMHARIAGVVRGAETLDVWRARVDAGLDGPKPRFGETAAMLGDADETALPQPAPRPRQIMREGLQRRYAEEGQPERGVEGMRD
jgi:uncharacterized protein (DUF4415 family)